MEKHTSRLRVRYQKEIAPEMEKIFAIENKMSIPKVTKVVVNMGIGEAVKNKEFIAKASADLAKITGQAPSIRRAKISVASFGVRKGMPVGLKTTLRRDRMYDFLDKLFSIVLPRLRDFRGLPKKGFDNFGNYTMGFVDHTVFPEIDLASVTKVFGLEITIVTSTKDGKQAEKLLELLGLPFVKD